jgi:hypothetical protein
MISPNPRPFSYTIFMTSANEAWITLFRRIPTNLHDTLTLGITTGAEIVVQKIVRLEPDFMIIRGRLAGTQDAGRIVMIPYAQLTFVAVLRDLKDAEIESIFGKAAPAAVADLPSPPANEDAAPEPVAEEPTVNEPAAAVNPVKKPEPISKTSLVAKLRDRLKEQGK